MKIGIIGSGNMGRSLGLLWTERGHEVFFGVRNQEQGEQIIGLARQASMAPHYGSNPDAAAFGDVLLYTPRAVPISDVLGPRFEALLNGKIVIDPGNQEVPPDFAYPAIESSLAEELARQAPHARVVKAFNTIPMETFELCPDAIRPHQVAVFVAADDQNARHTVLQLAGELGFVPIDTGALRQARLLETASNLIRLLIIGQGRAGTNFSMPLLPTANNPRLGGRQPSKFH